MLEYQGTAWDRQGLPLALGGSSIVGGEQRSVAMARGLPVAVPRVHRSRSARVLADIDGDCQAIVAT